MKAHFTFLGTGGSLGVPIIGCSCEVCRSSLPHNKRLRPSGLIEVGKKRFLIDAGPDFRTQALRHPITQLDGVLLTHSHFDHIAGLDDLRVFYFQNLRPLPCLLSRETCEELKTRYHYLLPPESANAYFHFQILDQERGHVDFQGLSWQYLTYFQGKMKVTGYRLGHLAYVSDIREYPEEILTSLKGVEILILSALRHTPSEVHFSVDEAVDFARKVGARRTWLTHIAHELDHEKTNAKLPSDIQLSYDGLNFEFEG